MFMFMFGCLARGSHARTTQVLVCFLNRTNKLHTEEKEEGREKKKMKEEERGTSSRRTRSRMRIRCDDHNDDEAKEEEGE